LSNSPQGLQALDHGLRLGRCRLHRFFDRQVQSCDAGFCVLLKIDDWDRMIDVNVRGVLYGICGRTALHEAAKIRAILFRPTRQEY
jgi:hypothetical protein